MHMLFEGVFVEETEDSRTYVIEADYSEHIKSIKSSEHSQQQISLRGKAPIKEILQIIKAGNFYAKIAEDGLIHVQTEDPVKLVRLLCEEHYIDIEQATAIIVHEIEHIKNPKMQELISGRKRLKEIREVVIQHKISETTESKKPFKLERISKKTKGK